MTIFKSLLRKNSIKSVYSYFNGIIRNCPSFPVDSLQIDFSNIRKSSNLVVPQKKSSLWIDIDFLNENYDKTEVAWEKIREKCITGNKLINDKNVNAIILEYFIANDLYENAKYFANYVMKEKKLDEINLGLFSKLLKTYCVIQISNKHTDNELFHVSSICKHLKEKYSILDHNTLKYMTLSLALQSKWNESMATFKVLKETADLPKSNIYCHIVEAAFKDEQIDIGWNLINDMAESNKYFDNRIFHSWLNMCIKKFHKPKDLLAAIERLLYFIAKNNIILEESIIKYLLEIFTKNINWVGNIVKINNSGLCVSCNAMLSSNALTNEEFERLKVVFHEKVLVGKHSFAKTSPDELNAFTKFLEQNEPFDIVVDGLNIAYSRKIHSPELLSKSLITVVNIFLNNNKKILVLGRSHMLRWPNFHYIKENAKIFLTNDLSYDDPFLLYAAMRTPDTYFVSRDFMRQNKFLLESKDIIWLFKKWQQSRQFHYSYVNGRITILPPIDHCTIAHKKIGWHIPYKIVDQSKDISSYISYPVNWLCVQPTKSRKAKKN